jgi:hypothetical protein
MSAHRAWNDIVDVFPAQSDCGDAGTFTCDRFWNYLPVTLGAGSETRTIAAPSKPCFISVKLVTDGGGSLVVGFDGAIDSSGNLLWTAADAGDIVHLVALPGTGGWRLLFNDGGSLS